MLHKFYAGTSVIILATSMLFLSSCSQRLNPALGGFSGETVKFRWENFRVSVDEFILKEDSIAVISYKDHTIYRFPSYRYLTTTNLNKEGEFIGEQTTTISVFKYYVHKNDDQFGLMFDSISAVRSSGKLPVDSIMIKQAFKNPRFFALPNVKLVEELKKDDIIRVTYAAFEKAKDQRDTVGLYYDRNTPDFRYSFSNSLNWENMEPFRIRYVFNEFLEDGVTIPKRVMLFELKRMKIGNSGELKRLIELHDRLIQE